jgi:hypothetical protein
MTATECLLLAFAVAALLATVVPSAMGRWLRLTVLYRPQEPEYQRRILVIRVWGAITLALTLWAIIRALDTD